jgi:transketolase N-terminal domain/subunit
MNRQDRTAEYVKLEEHVFSVKKLFLAMYKKAHAGHIGSSLSCAEILVFLKFGWMRDDDTFILSKGQAVAALYSLLAEANVLAPSSHTGSHHCRDHQGSRHSLHARHGGFPLLGNGRCTIRASS